MNETLLAAVAQAAAPNPLASTAATTDSTAATAADIAKAKAEGKAEGLAEGRKVERERAKAILGSDEAKGREALASHLAFGTDMEAAAAVDLMKVSAKTEAPKPGSRLDALVTDPKVTDGGPKKTDAEVAETGLSAAVDRLINQKR